MDPWIIQPVERARHLEQFRGLGPVGNFVTGDQAKGFLLQSGLPPPVLGQIWSLADANCDGKMDINEFSVACKLITMKLKGFEVPAVLPLPLKSVLAGSGLASPVLSPMGSGYVTPTNYSTGTATPPLAQIRPTTGMMTPPVNLPLQQPGVLPAAVAPGVVPGVRPSFPSQDSIHKRSMSITSHDSLVSPPPQLMEWAVPNASRLKYTQMFNTHDRTKSGYLTGVQARNILLETALPQNILAQVWALSDLDSDGRLSCEEFVLSLHLCDLARQTGKLPPSLPADLIPPSFRVGSRKQSLVNKSLAGSIAGSGPTTPTLDPEKVISPTGSTGSFEDKRRENYDKGQAELDRRRKVIQDMEAREREERQRKEREEFERKEKARLEQERKAQEERERQLALQREAEERKMDEFKRLEEQKEEARKEMERARQNELMNTKRNELLARRQKEQEEVLRLKGVNNGLGLEVSHLSDRVKELSTKITETRSGVSSVKSEIDGMRSKRDLLMSEMSALKGQLKDQNNRMIHAAQEKLRLEKLAAESETKQANLKLLREKLENLREEFDKKDNDSKESQNELTELKSTLSTIIESCKSIYDEYKEKREKVIVMRKKHHEEFDPNAAWGSVSPAAPAGLDESTGPTYYRALFDFEGRSEDELSFSAGAIIQKNDEVVPDPGWLAGILDGQSGWFPESFVEIYQPDEYPEETVAAAPLERIESVEAAPAGGSYYVALFPYTSEEPTDLVFEAGEVIYVTANEGEWWSGQIGQDRIGIFPANYVAPHEASADATAPSTTDTSAARGLAREPSKTELEPYEEAEIKREISEIAHPPAAVQKSPKVRVKRYEIATVLANYQPTGSGQLLLNRGQIVTVKKKSPSGWWEGELQSKGGERQIGWFPGSYVKILGPSGGSRQSSSRTTPIHFDDYEMPTMDAPVYSSEVRTATPLEKVVALYPYTAQNSDELTFTKDDQITVISKDEPDWWKGQLGTAVGMFPVNYVQNIAESGAQSGTSRNSSPWGSTTGSATWSANGFDDSGSGSTTNAFYQNIDTVEQNTVDRGSTTTAASTVEQKWQVLDETTKKRQEAIQELIDTENSYMSDMTVVKTHFMEPLRKTNLLTAEELQTIFVNWDDLVDCSGKLLKAFNIRKMTGNNAGQIFLLGDILCQHLPAMNTYIRFCSAQLRSAALLQRKSEENVEFLNFCKNCASSPRVNGMPLSSFLLKPTQRITKYPLLIKKILKYTPEDHGDRHNLEEALSKAEELCAQVNEGVREEENSDRLEWLQNHVICEGFEERIIFNSATNSLGPRKFLHYGSLKKIKSGKELFGFLFNDFLLLTLPSKSLINSSFSFDRNKNMKFRSYRKPIFLNKITLEEESTMAENEFIIGTEDDKIPKMYLAALGVSEKRLWMKSIKEAKTSMLKIEQQNLKRQRSIRKRPAKGHLRVTVISGMSIANRDAMGKSDPYCEVSLGSEVKRTQVLNATLNPKWNHSMQFSVKDLQQDILSFTVFDKDQFSPDQFLGRTEIPISKIVSETVNRKTPWKKKFPLHEIESGEILIKLHLQIFERS